MKLLIELPTWLGDTVMTTPAFENLVACFDDPEITIIGSAISIEVLKNHPRVIRSYVLSKKYNLRLLSSGLLYRYMSYKLISNKKLIDNNLYLKKILKKNTFN